MHRTVDYLTVIRNAPITALNVCGGVSCNQSLISEMSEIANIYEMPLTRNPSHLCTDNAAMIAWMGWESINAQMNLDIRSF